MTRSLRCYRWLLRAYPASVRAAYGADMEQLFQDQWRDADGSMARAGVIGRTVVDTASAAPRERLAARRSRRVAEGPTFVEQARRPLMPGLLVALAPLLLLVVFLTIAPGFMEPVFDSSASFLGQPLGAVMLVGGTLLACPLLFAAARGRHRILRAILIAGGILAWAALVVFSPVVVLLVTQVGEP